MRTLEILIEQNAPGSSRPMEVAANAPVSVLVPAIVDELQLPRTDLLGNPLVYVLRYAPTGTVLSDDKSLTSAGIQAGARLALDSFVMDGSVATLAQSSENRRGSQQPSFYASDTQGDSDALPALGKHTSASLPAVRSKRKGRWSRRAFIALAGAAIGAGVVGVGYGAYNRLLTGTGNTGAVKTQSANHSAPAHTNTTAKGFTPPTTATAALVFKQHRQTVRAVSWSPGGDLLASGANDRLLMTWNVNGVVRTQLQQSGTVHAAAWSPDGQWLAAGSTNRVTLFNAHTGVAQAQTREAQNATVMTLSWSALQPSRLLSGSSDMQAIVWNVPTLTPQTDFRHHTAPILSATWAPDNLTVATSSQGGVIRVWNADNGQEVHGYYLDAQLPMRALAFAPVGQRLAVGGDDGIVRLWNGLTCVQQQQTQFGTQCIDVPQRLHAHTGIVRALAWSHDGRLLATGGDDGTLAIWYPSQGQAPLLRVRLDGPVLALSWSPNGKQVATASGKNVTLWNLA